MILLSLVVALLLRRAKQEGRTPMVLYFPHACSDAMHRASAGVDIAMNTHLKNVKLILKGQPAQQLDSMSVRGNQIR